MTPPSEMLWIAKFMGEPSISSFSFRLFAAILGKCRWSGDVESWRGRGLGQMAS
jgi:hypothetical protein